jgi:hypothetical protein
VAPDPRHGLATYPTHMTKRPTTGSDKLARFRQPPTNRVAVRFRVEVTARHEEPTPWGWRVFRYGQTRPVEQSASGYKTETDAWSAGGSVVTRLEVAAAR